MGSVVFGPAVIHGIKNMAQIIAAEMQIIALAIGSFGFAVG